MSGAATFRTSAEAYDRYIGRYGPELARALCHAAGVQAGQRALDVGCGPGALTAELVARLGAANVAAVDPSRPFVEACRLRHPGVRVEEAAAERLPFEDGAFDGALAQLVVNFMTDAAAGVREMARVTRSGGTVGAAVWDYGGKMTLLRAFWDAVVALDPSARDRDEGRAMRFCTPEELGGLWSQAGFAAVQVTPAVVRAAYEDFEDLWRPLESGIGPAGAYVAGLAADGRAALHAEFERRLAVPSARRLAVPSARRLAVPSARRLAVPSARGHGMPGGPFELTARAWLVTGRAD